MQPQKWEKSVQNKNFQWEKNVQDADRISEKVENIGFKKASHYMPQVFNACHAKSKHKIKDNVEKLCFSQDAARLQCHGKEDEEQADGERQRQLLRLTKTCHGDDDAIDWFEVEGQVDSKCREGLQHLYLQHIQGAGANRRECQQPQEIWQCGHYAHRVVAYSKEGQDERKGNGSAYHLVHDNSGGRVTRRLANAPIADGEQCVERRRYHAEDYAKPILHVEMEDEENAKHREQTEEQFAPRKPTMINQRFEYGREEANK